ncbi:response regulator [Donghicola mangrovi]|nr:response regulator [Donghicola mangrovi]
MNDDDLRNRMTRPTPTRPLNGLSLLLVEDSRFTCEALRLMCMRSGARIRRADCLRSAHRHLSIYRPDCLMVDLGLPDGNGCELLQELTDTGTRPPVLIAISGDVSQRQAALDAGAHAFLAKPLSSLAVFQETILGHLPLNRHPTGPRMINEETIRPDQLAYYDDLSHVVHMLDEGRETIGDKLGYALQFLRGVAISADDTPISDAVEELSRAVKGGHAIGTARANLAALLQQRMNALAVA